MHRTFVVFLSLALPTALAIGLILALAKVAVAWYVWLLVPIVLPLLLVGLTAVAGRLYLARRSRPCLGGMSQPGSADKLAHRS